MRPNTYTMNQNVNSDLMKRFCGPHPLALPPQIEKRIFKVFIGGVDPKMNEEALVNCISQLGPVHSVYMKKRHNNENLNLGHAILYTFSKDLFEELLSKRFIYINQNRLECRQYFSSEKITLLKQQKAGKTLIISGFPMDMQLGDFQKLFANLHISYENLMLIMKQKNDSFTGKIRLILHSEKAAKSLYQKIQGKDYQSFPPCEKFALLVERENTLLQLKKEKRELKESKKQAKLIQKRSRTIQNINKSHARAYSNEQDFNYNREFLNAQYLAAKHRTHFNCGVVEPKQPRYDNFQIFKPENASPVQFEVKSGNGSHHYSSNPNSNRGMTCASTSTGLKDLLNTLGSKKTLSNHKPSNLKFTLQPTQFSVPNRMSQTSEPQLSHHNYNYQAYSVNPYGPFYQVSSQIPSRLERF